MILCVIFMAGPAMAADIPDVPCPTNLGSCTASDVVTTLTIVEILSPNNQCEADGKIDLRLTTEFDPTAAKRYDLGLFIADDGGPVNNGASCVGTIAPLPTFPDLDSDLCGDLNGLNTGPLPQGPVDFTFDAKVDCNIIDGKLVIPSCRVWDQNGRVCLYLTLQSQVPDPNVTVYLLM